MTLKKLYSSFFLLLLGGMMIKTQVLIGDGTKSIIDGFVFIFLAAIYILSFLIIIVKMFIEKQKVSFNYRPILATIIVFFAIVLVFNKDIFESSTILNAESAEGNRLSLKEDFSFTIQIRDVEWSRFYKGKYKVNLDTLILCRKDIQINTDSAFADKYLVCKKKRILIPLNRHNCQKDTTKLLTIL